VTNKTKPSKLPLITSFFSIGGWDFDTDACTAAIGISPTRIWRQSHAHLAQHPDIPNTNWTVELEHRQLYSLDDGLAELFALLLPSRDRILSFLQASGLRGGFGSNVTIRADRPLYHLSPETLSTLASFHCEYLMDIYDYTDDHVA